MAEDKKQDKSIILEYTEKYEKNGQIIERKTVIDTTVTNTKPPPERSRDNSGGKKEGD